MDSKFKVDDTVQIRNAEWPPVDGALAKVRSTYYNERTKQMYYELHLEHGDDDSPEPYQVTVHESCLAFPEEEDPDGWYL